MVFTNFFEAAWSMGIGYLNLRPQPSFSSEVVSMAREEALEQASLPMDSLLSLIDVGLGQPQRSLKRRAQNAAETSCGWSRSTPAHVAASAVTQKQESG